MMNNSEFPCTSSVIVCTYNRSSLLIRSLKALASQTAPMSTFQIIVVDDGSTDDTAGVCNSMTAQLPNMKYIPLGRNCGLSAAGNRAIAEARGKYLLFTDDDCIPQPDWVEKMNEALEGSPLAAGTMISTTSDYFKLCHNIAQFYPFMPGQKARKIDFIAGANMGIRSDLIKEIGEFDTETIIPDMEFILRARQKGYSIMFTPDAAIIHDPMRVTLRSILGYAAKHASVTVLFRHQYRELLHTPFILFSPSLILLFAPLIAFKTTASIYFGNRKLWRYLHTAPIVYLTKMAWCWGAARGLLKKERNLH